MKLLAFAALSLLISSCVIRPSVAPTPSEMKQLLYSLYQSNISNYKCDVHSEMLQTMSEFEFNMLFKELFKRESTLQERGMLKKMKWLIHNSNENQDVIPYPALKEFPSAESRDIVERTSKLLTIINKVLTLTYIETFADRPDLALVHIGERYFQVIGSNEEVVAELEYNRKKYRIFFGSRRDQIEVTLAKLGSMAIPEKIELKSVDQNAVIFPKFEIRQGFPQVDQVNVQIPQLGNTLLKFPFQLCQYSQL